MSFWKRKKKIGSEKLPWYRDPNYTGNLTEYQKRQLDAFRMQPKHPAASEEDLPEEVQNYITSRETELHDTKMQGAFNTAATLIIFVGLLLYFTYDSSRSSWQFVFAVGALVWIWFEWHRKTKQEGEKYSDYERTDELIRQEWELKYLSRHRGPNDERELARLEQNFSLCISPLTDSEDEQEKAVWAFVVGGRVSDQLETLFGTEAFRPITNEGELHQQSQRLDSLTSDQLAEFGEALKGLADEKFSTDYPTEKEERKASAEGSAYWLLSVWVNAKAIAKKSTEPEFKERANELETTAYNVIKGITLPSEEQEEDRVLRVRDKLADRLSHPK